MARKKDRLYSEMMVLASMHCEPVSGNVTVSWDAWESLARRVEALHDRLLDEIGPDDAFWDELRSSSRKAK